MINSNNRNINILLYHQIGDALDSETNPNCFCSVKEFYNQMLFLKNSNYKVISLNEAMDMIFKINNIDSNYVVLTFDTTLDNGLDFFTSLISSITSFSKSKPKGKCSVIRMSGITFNTVS